MSRAGAGARSPMGGTQITRRLYQRGRAGKERSWGESVVRDVVRESYFVIRELRHSTRARWFGILGARFVGMHIPGKAVFVAIRIWLSISPFGLRRIFDLGTVAVSPPEGWRAGLLFAPVFEVGWARKARRVVMITRTPTLYHTSIGGCKRNRREIQNPPPLQNPKG
jgi:hypothetical protein